MDDRAFADFLIQEGVLNETGLAKGRQIQEIFPARIDTILVATDIVPERSIEKALGKFLKTRTIGSVEFDTIDRQIAWLLSPRVVRRFKTLPFRKDGKRLHVVSLEPIDLLVEDELSMLTGCMITSFVGIEFRIMECLSRMHGFDLTPQLDAIIRKMRGLPSSFTGIAPVIPREPGQIKTKKPKIAPKPKAPVTKPTSIERAPRIVRHQPPSEQQEPAAPPPPQFVELDELEIDDEDLALFPTLNQGAYDEDETGETPVVPATPPKAVPPQPPAVSTAPPPPTAIAPPPLPPEPPPPEPEVEFSPEERLVMAANHFQDAEMRDDIGDAILEFCAPYLQRRMLLVVRKGKIVGWRGEGSDVDEIAVRAISIPLEEPSVFLPLTQGTAFWLGALPPMPRNIELVFGLGGAQPRDCVILPVKVRDRLVCFLYGDNVDEGVSGVPMSLLRRLVAKAGLAFQVYIMKSKIRLV